MPLNEAEIQTALECVVSALHVGNRVDALGILKSLEFERLRSVDPTMPIPQFDLVAVLGRARVKETGDLITSCWAALFRGNDTGAVTHATAALERWKRG